LRDFDVQSVEIPAPFAATFAYVADPSTLPEWTHAFRSVSNGRAVLATPNGSVEARLEVLASLESGTVDWIMTFPDGSVGKAYSRVVKAGEKRSIYTFVLMAPPVPLEQVEGALEQQARVLREELAQLKRKLSR
jgi:hypothetical protein